MKSEILIGALINKGTQCNSYKNKRMSEAALGLLQHPRWSAL